MIRKFIEKVVLGKNLDESEAFQAMERIMRGEATPAQVAALITAWRMKGETVGEITGCALAMREASVRIAVKRPEVELDQDESGMAEETVLDTCGTGGDCANTFNISTAVALVAAGAGITVAKHGNRSVSSRSGSADVLEALGVNLQLSPEQVKLCIEETGIGFLFAPLFHPAMKFAVGPRREIGIRTVFNILGPLTNPAGANTQIVGVYDPKLTEVMAGVLKKLGVRRAWAVHGDGVLDEFSLSGPTRMSRMSREEEQIQTVDVAPEDFGLERAGLGQLTGGTPQENAGLLRGIFGGAAGPRTDAVLMNSAAVLVICERAPDFKTGVAMAREVIASGKAARKLEQLIEASRRLGGGHTP